jgi:hypothetical protein
MAQEKPQATAKKSFILYLDFADTLDHLTDKQAGIVFKAIYTWQQTGALPELDLAMKLVLAPLVAQFKRDTAKWDDIRVKRSESGKKGAKQKLANAGKRKQSLANLAVSGSVSVNDSVNEINTTPSAEEASEPSDKKQKRFTAPTEDEVRAYVQERGSAVDPQTFVDFYAAKGWMIGKNKVKDWKACVRTWEKREQKDDGLTAKQRKDYGI